MRRRYAFEAEGVSEEVKSQLEIAEDAVEKNCETPEDCDKMLDKIDGQAEKFDNALQTMSDAAKDCKDGKCDASEMKDKITPAMADLKEVAKTIGIAKEGDEGPVTEEDLKDVKAYLEGAKEIVEAKKDELGGDSDSGDDDEKKCASDKDEEEADEACESMLDALEAYTDNLDIEIASIAMESTTGDAGKIRSNAMNEVKAMAKEFKTLKKEKNYAEAAKKAREIASRLDNAKTEVGQLPQSTKTSVITDIIAIVATVAAIAATASVVSGAIGTAGKAAKVYTALGDISSHSRGDLRYSIGRGLKTAGKNMAISGGLYGAAGATGGAVAGSALNILQQRKAVDADGNIIKRELEPNDFNVVINAIKGNITAAKKAWLAAAEKMEKLAKDSEATATQEGTATESFMSDAECDAAVESMLAACESYIDDLDIEVAGIAMESATSDAKDINTRALNDIKDMVKEFKSLKKAKDYSGAAKKAREIANKLDTAKTEISQLPQDTKAAVIATVGKTVTAIASIALIFAAFAGSEIYTTARALGANSNFAKKVAVGGAKKMGAFSGGAAAIGGGLGVTVSVLQQRKVIDADGNVVKKTLEPNDFNVIINAIKGDLAVAKKAWVKAAEKMEKKAAGKDSDKGSDAEPGSAQGTAQMSDAAESFIAACESLKIGYTPERSAFNSFLLG